MDLESIIYSKVVVVELKFFLRNHHDILYGILKGVKRMNEWIITIIVLVLFFLLLPILFAICFLIFAKVLCPFYEWYLGKLENLWDRLTGGDKID